MKKSAAFLMVAVLCSIATSSLSAQEVGIQLYSLRNQFKTDVPGTLKLIGDWGITHIEGGGTYGMSMSEYKGLLKQNNLITASVGAGFEELRDNPEKAIKNAKEFGAKYIMCAWVPHKGNQFALEETKNAVDVFNRAGKLIEEAGLVLAYHAHGYEFRPYKDGTLFDYMVEHADHFAFEMDVYWVQHGGEDPLKLLRKYPSKFPLMHLKDMEKGVKGNNTGHEDVETNVVLGTGQVDMAGLVREAKKIGVEYMFIEDESSRVVEQVPLSLAFLKSLK